MFEKLAEQRRKERAERDERLLKLIRKVTGATDLSGNQHILLTAAHTTDGGYVMVHLRHDGNIKVTQYAPDSLDGTELEVADNILEHVEDDGRTPKPVAPVEW